MGMNLTKRKFNSNIFFFYALFLEQKCVWRGGEFEFV